jgi:RNA ligase
MNEMNKAIKNGYVRTKVLDNLVLYRYTDKCVHDKAWNNSTRIARGLILNSSDNYSMVAHPFPKFFNLEEMPESRYSEIIKHKEYEVYDKLDGSLGITYFHDGKLKIATVGSFESEQAIEATKMLHELYPDFCNFERKYHDISNITFLFEIIYPSNKIVCDYNGERKLVMLAAFFYRQHNHLGVDYEADRSLLETICNEYNIPIVDKFNHTIDEMIALQKTLPKDKEGFVVRFKNGLRVKIKGDEYLKIHKLVTMCSPLSVWENMKYGEVSKEITMGVPEEYLEEFNKISYDLNIQYHKIYSELRHEFIYNFKEYYINESIHFALNIFENNMYFKRLPTPEERKEIGLYIKNNPEKFKHASCIFPLLLNKSEAVDKYIMGCIKPKANKMIDLE